MFGCCGGKAWNKLHESRFSSCMCFCLFFFCQIYGCIASIIMQPVLSLKICLSLSSTHCEKNYSDKIYLKNFYLIKFIRRVINFQIWFLYFNNILSIDVFSIQFIASLRYIDKDSTWRSSWNDNIKMATLKKEIILWGFLQGIFLCIGYSLFFVSLPQDKMCN